MSGRGGTLLALRLDQTSPVDKRVALQFHEGKQFFRGQPKRCSSQHGEEVTSSRLDPRAEDGGKRDENG